MIASRHPIVHSGTGAELWLLGWKLARDGDLRNVALGGDVLRGFAAYRVARAKFEPIDDDAALRAWAAS